MASDESKKIKVINPKEEDDVQLPELPSWEQVVGRPTSLADLDPTAEALLEDTEATILSLGDVAYLDSITTTYIADNAITTPKLLAGAVIASKISANAVTASKIDVDELSAISADLGSITAGTITGALIRTSSGGDRVEIDDGDDSIKIYDSGDLRLELYQDRITFYEDDGFSDVVNMYASPTGNFLMAGTGSNDILFSSARDMAIDVADDLTIIADDTININTGSLADDIFIGLGLNTFMQFGNGRIYLDTYFDMQGFDITDAGSIVCVSLTETSDIRTKKNIKKLRYGLEQVLQLEPIQYQFKKPAKKNSADRRIKKPGKNKETLVDTRGDSENGIDQLGFSAQDVFKIMPELTKYADKNGEETARLYTTQMIPVLVNAIQELHSQVQALSN